MLQNQGCHWGLGGVLSKSERWTRSWSRDLPLHLPQLQRTPSFYPILFVVPTLSPCEVDCGGETHNKHEAMSPSVGLRWEAPSLRPRGRHGEGRRGDLPMLRKACILVHTVLPFSSAIVFLKLGKIIKNPRVGMVEEMSSVC